MTSRTPDPTLMPVTPDQAAMIAAQSKLVALQTEFLVAQQDAVLAAQIFGATAPQVAIYANNSRGANVEAVVAAYPTLVVLLGTEAARAMAADYVAAHPPYDWDLNRFGGGLAQFILQANAEFQLLADVGALDWAIHDATFAPETAALEPGSLLSLNGEAMEALRFQPRPTTHFVASTEPIGTLLKAAREVPFLRPEGSAEAVLVGRDGQRRVWFRILESGERAFTAAMLQGQTLAAAAAAALSADVQFDLGATLSQHFADQVWLSPSGEMPTLGL